MRTTSLCYHDVVFNGDLDASGFPGADAATYKLDIGSFRSHIATLAEAAVPCLLTFDDGGSSAYTCIADELERCGYFGYFFITTDYIGARSFLSADQILALHNRGHVIGSHSCSHRGRMSHLSHQRLTQEWGRSTDILSEIVGEPVTSASVPSGYYSEVVARAASSVGIRTLFTQEPTTTRRQVDDCTVLGRFTVRRWTSAETVAALVRSEAAPRLKQWLLWHSKKVPKSVCGKLYPVLRRFYFKRRRVMLTERRGA